MKKIYSAIIGLTSIALLVQPNQVQAQDIHFSQFNNAELMVNPGHAGIIPGTNRVGLNYRSRWSDFGDGFRTFAFSYDQKYKPDSWSNGHLGIGVNVFKDAAGDVQLSNTKANITLSSVIKLNIDQYLSLGLQGGISQRSIDPTKMLWDDQFVGTQFDPTRSTQDDFAATSFLHGDLAAGMVYTYYTRETNIATYDEFKMKIGLSAYHLTRPAMNYLGDDDRQYMRFNLHGLFFLANKLSNTAIMPSYIISVQGPSKDILFGGHYRVRMKENSRFTGLIDEVAVSFGMHYRWADALVPSVNLELENFTIGLSYDTNISKIQSATQMQGGLEISLKYINPGTKRKSTGQPML
jgi:type IX secretion system PorP/SprF family membrane protein